MSLLVTGSIGIDTVETPDGRADAVLGGSAVYFSLAAALFSGVRLVGVVGDDFDERMLEPLRERPIDTRGLERRRGSKTFRWHGRYMANMNDRETVAVDLNVLAEKNAEIPRDYHDSRFVFLANTHPGIQKEFADQLRAAQLIVCDTMDLWIQTAARELERTLASVHGVVFNESEVRLLTGRSNLVAAGREILKMGPRFVVIKKGEHGSLMISRDDLFVMPAYPTMQVVDPTGCGDCFAGALMGHLTALGRSDSRALRGAMARGSVVASYVIEDFSVAGLARAGHADIERRLRELAHMSSFD
jgi:sugar/nucleoside kinase (ribokinase family)